MKKLFTILAACFGIVALNAQTARVVLQADDVWGDGTGYQMLLDNTASLFGTVIPEEGSLANCGEGDAIYAQFSHRLPANADADCNTQNIVIANAMAIDIPAGTYDWCITNPTPGSVIWIASGNGNVGGRQNDYVFEANKTYTFSIILDELTGNDQTDLTIQDGIVGVQESSIATFSVSPNPATTTLTINGNNINTVEVINLLGQTVMTTNNTEINVSNLTNGAYFVRVNFQNGEVATQKFIKK